MTCLLALGCTKSSDDAAAAGSSAPENPQVPVPAPETQEAADTRPAIVTFGDSLSEGYGAEPGESYPDYLQQAIDRKGYSYKVVNMGISGDTTTGGLNRIRAAIALDPEIVILELGGNDGLRGLPVPATRDNLEKMIAALRDADIEVVLAGMTLPPNYGPEYIKSFEQMYRDLAKKHDLTFIPFLLEDIARKFRENPGLMQRDGIHPTAEGNRLVADTVIRYLEPLLKRRQAHSAG